MGNQQARLGILAILVIAAGSGGLLARQRARPPVPRALFHTMRIDLGSLPAETSREAHFTLQNQGGADLHILEAEGGCGCLTVTFPRKLRPGATGQLRVKFTPLPAASGRVERRVRVRTDDPRRPEAELTLAAEVIPLLRTEPRSPIVVNYRRGVVYQREVRLIPRPGSAPKVSVSPPESAYLKARMEPPAPSDPERAYRLRLVIGPYDRPGDLSLPLEVSTSAPHLPIVPLTILCQAVSGPVVSPTQLYLASVGPGEDGKELNHLQVFTRSGELRLLGVDTGDPGLQAEVTEKTPRRFYDVILRYAGGWRPGQVQGTIRVQTDDPQDPVLRVAFSGDVRQER
jgi:hypothetical protein